MRSRIFAVAGVFSAVCLTTTASATLVYDPVVVVAGTGATTSGNGFTTSISIFQKNVANQAGPVSTTSYNSSASGTRLVMTVSSTSEGSLTNNPGVSNAAAVGSFYAGTQYVYNAGYDAATNTAAVQGTTANANRSFGQTNVTNLSASGATVLQTQTQATAYNNNTFRGAVGDDTGTAKYTAGNAATAANGGWRNFAANTILAASPTNVRTVELLGGNLFGTTGSGTTGIYRLDASGASSGAAATVYLATGTSSDHSPYEFALFDDPNLSVTLNMGFDTAYIADDSTALASGVNAGIQKWTWNGTTWSQAYILKDTGLAAYRGLAGQLDPDTGLITLFATVQDATTTKLQQVTDTGVASTFTTLASMTTASGFVFRGVALSAAAVPESSLIAALGAAMLGVGGVWASRRRAKASQ